MAREEGVDKFYLSHLVYAGRGDKLSREDDGLDHLTSIARGDGPD